jgi:hypothetical protein
LITLLRIKLNLKIIETFIWQCVFVILLVVSKFLAMRAEHTVAPLQNSDITRTFLTVWALIIIKINVKPICIVLKLKIPAGS